MTTESFWSMLSYTEYTFRHSLSFSLSHSHTHHKTKTRTNNSHPITNTFVCYFLGGIAMTAICIFIWTLCVVDRTALFCYLFHMCWMVRTILPCSSTKFTCCPSTHPPTWQAFSDSLQQTDSHFMSLPFPAFFLQLFWKYLCASHSCFCCVLFPRVETISWSNKSKTDKSIQTWYPYDSLSCKI